MPDDCFNSSDVPNEVVKPNSMEPGLLRKVLRQAAKDNRPVTLYTHLHMFTGFVSLPIEHHVVVLIDGVNAGNQAAPGDCCHHWVTPSIIYAVTVLPEGIDFSWSKPETD